MAHLKLGNSEINIDDETLGVIAFIIFLAICVIVGAK